MRKPVLARIVVTCSAIAMLGCVAKSDKAVVGKYVATTPCAMATLTIRHDHSFVQDERVNTTVRQRSGHWKLVNGWVIFEMKADAAGDRSFLVPIPGAARVERLTSGYTMGPLIITCSDSQHEFDYIKPWLGN